jgi:DNA polymerase
MGEKTWAELERACGICGKCKLSETRTNVVVGVGNRTADVLFIGEGPGCYEDQQGEPFVGKAGQLLDKMLAAIGLDRKQVYIANVIKCRPPDNRDPAPEEIAACINYLRYQLLLIQPKIIVCLGRIAAKTIINPDFRITAQRGVWFEKKGYHMIATYHPSALLRDNDKKKDAWIDMQRIRDKLAEIMLEKGDALD